MFPNYAMFNVRNGGWEKERKKKGTKALTSEEKFQFVHRHLPDDSSFEMMKKNKKYPKKIRKIKNFLILLSRRQVFSSIESSRVEAEKTIWHEH